ncbi:winged helix-turn-helix domain-containing protein [Romboutsia timonensis]|uniref:winged helix-turn-helix domain-containing protein n=1 Tax=Romboutsia timonensis TaxID=1776391 RepID=UPI001B6B4BF0|nr:winged helix-turn-helix domain-containing protein [Romboutsia timonensis]MBP3931041.1 winged helix-turn-helix transcriptional regulator [Peptostreptococcaceae bacterium]
MLNNNDYIILSSVRDKDNNLGLCKARGMTIDSLVDKSKLSTSTVRRSIKKLLDREFIDYGVRQINKNTFYVTEKGLMELKSVSKIIKIKGDNL